MYERLTTFIPKLMKDDSDKWLSDTEIDVNPERLYQMPSVSRDVIQGLTEEIYAFADAHPEYGLGHYGDILHQHGLDWSMKSMRAADVSGLDGQAVMALLVGAVRAEHYCTHPVLDLCEDGSIGRWLARLKELDEEYADTQ